MGNEVTKFLLDHIDKLERFQLADQNLFNELRMRICRLRDLVEKSYLEGFNDFELDTDAGDLWEDSCSKATLDSHKKAGSLYSSGAYNGEK